MALLVGGHLGGRMKERLVEGRSGLKPVGDMGGYQK